MVDQTAMVCVQDDTGTTISLPPLTNCELSKVDRLAFTSRVCVQLVSCLASPLDHSAGGQHLA